MPLVLAAIGPESLGELLTEITLEQWPAAAVGDVLPALHVLDPDEADEPAVAIALDRAGSWAGLLSLTGRELVDQPFIQARPVLNTLFSAVLVRLAHPHAAARHVEAHHHEAAVPESQVSGGAASEQAAAESVAPEPARYDAEPQEPASRDAALEDASQEAALENGALEDGEPQDGASQEGAFQEGVAEEESAGREDEPVLDADVEPVVEEGLPSEPDIVLDDAAEPAPEPAAEEASALEAEGVGQEPEPVAPAFAEAPEAPEAPEVAEAGEPTNPDEHDEPAVPGEPAHPAGAFASAGHAFGAANAFEAAQQAESAQKAEASEQDEPAEASEPAEREHAEAGPHGEQAEQSEQDEQPEQSEQELPELIEAAFAGLDDKSWAVAQNRIFTDEPSAIDQLAKLFAVPPADISATEHDLRLRLDQWLGSEKAAPYRAHLDELRRTLGPAAPKEQLIGAADWHATEIRALEVPAWQFVLATMPAQPRAAQPPAEFQQPHSAFGAVPQPPPPPPGPPPGPPQFQAFTPATPAPEEANGGSEQNKPYQPLKDVSQTRRCFRQPDGRWWLRIDVTAEQLAGGECALPTGFAAYLGLSPGESRAVRSAAGELTMTWHGRPVLESIERLLVDVGAKEGGHLFLTLSDEGVLRARHLPVAAQNAESITKALRLVGYTAPGGTRDQAARVIATRIGLTGPVGLPDLLTRLRERGDRDLLALLD
ncbi:hypothetical protein [Nonomuraea sp. WAC 01424]|uniref:hypothetical protein n=1 Tax=Nonomuraea sp. WAC 01424 TaxID=2203200 RepID=UPI000F7A394F|nr:hypothetical protein [Nonomuraea sp. WAC 01424]